MNIGIFIDNTDTHWGPGRLAYNTIKAFEQNNINYKINEFYDYNLSISGNQFHWKFFGHTVKNPIIGPCSFNDPTQCFDAFNLYPKFLVASEWYKKNWVSYGVSENKIDSWFGGIDVDLFKPNKDVKYDCLIMLKSRSREQLGVVQNILSKYNLTSIVLEYGLYNEDKFINFVNSCKFGIILHNTETQGFAIMEALSMGLPMLVLDTNTWGDRFFDATSVPYFDETCGIKIHENDFNPENIENKLIMLLNNIENYNPRDFILNNHTFTHSVNLLRDVFTNVWG